MRIVSSIVTLPVVSQNSITAAQTKQQLPRKNGSEYEGPIPNRAQKNRQKLIELERLLNIQKYNTIHVPQDANSARFKSTQKKVRLKRTLALKRLRASEALPNIAVPDENFHKTTVFI